MSDAEAQNLADDLRRSIGGFVRAIRHDTGSTRSAQSETLDVLDRNGPMNVAALAQTRRVTHQTMRMVVVQLEASSLVKQKIDHRDRRSRIVSICPAGREALLQEQAMRTACIAEAIRSKLSPDERDLIRVATAILNRLASPLP